MAKLSTLSLSELYDRPKITPAVEREILSKDSFTAINQTYCDKVCRLRCKAPSQVRLQSNPVDILIIQDAQAPDGKFDRMPGAQEQLQRQIIDHMCKAAGMERVSYSLVSLLKCKPNNVDFPRGKAPTQTVLMKCSPYLKAEIEACKPKVIISLGTASTKALGLKKHSNTGNRGEIVQSEFGTVVITLHPRVLSMIRQTSSGAMWSADYYEVIRRDFEKALRLVTGQLVIPSLEQTLERYKSERITFCQSLPDVQRAITAIDKLPANAVISFDTETTGFDPLAPTAKLLTIQFGWRDPGTGRVVAAVVPLWHRKNRFYNPDLAWKLVAPLLLSDRRKVAHNGKFDILYIYWTTGVRVKNLAFDTMLLLHSIDSGTQGCYGLKVAMWDHLPELGFAGYEDLLPDLAKLPDEVVEEESEGNDAASV